MSNPACGASVGKPTSLGRSRLPYQSTINIHVTIVLVTPIYVNRWLNTVWFALATDPAAWPDVIQLGKDTGCAFWDSELTVSQSYLPHCFYVYHVSHCHLNSREFIVNNEPMNHSRIYKVWISVTTHELSSRAGDTKKIRLNSESTLCWWNVEWMLFKNIRGKVQIVNLLEFIKLD